MICQDGMTKITGTKPTTSTGTVSSNKSKLKRKKKKFWKHTVKKDPGEAPHGTKITPLLPPKVPQEFSSNWRALQAVLKPKTTHSSNLQLLLPTCTNKKHKIKKKKAKDVSVGKESSSQVQTKSNDKTEEKLKSPKAKVGQKDTKKEIAAQENHTSDLKDRPGKKKKRKNGFIESEEEHVKHKKRKPEEKVDKPLTEDDLWFDDVDPEDIEAALGPEAAQIARQKLGLPKDKPPEEVEQLLVKEKAFDGLTKAVAIDCEMVGVGPEGEDSIVARVSIVNHFGKCIYDKYVKPTEKVTDYRTAVSGIRPDDIKNGVSFKDVQRDVASIIEGRILVGHALHNDLKILFLDHPRKKIRDTQRYKPFKQEVKSGRPSLKLLCSKLLNVKVQSSEHSSVQDAQAAMRLYTLHKKQWEASIKAKQNEQKQRNKDKPQSKSS
ncbi:RNA exonuclease 4 [Pleurodeles waltl]